MKSLLVGAALAGAALVASISPAHACGDKFLVQGRGQSYYRMHMTNKPAAILIYENPASQSLSAVKKSKLEDALRGAGHRVTECGAQDCDLAVSVGGYDIVMADVADAGAVTQKLRTSSSRTLVLPVVVSKAPKADVEKAKSDYGYVYVAQSSPGRLLDYIDDVMTKRTRTASAGSAN